MDSGPDLDVPFCEACGLALVDGACPDCEPVPASPATTRDKALAVAKDHPVAATLAALYVGPLVAGGIVLLAALMVIALTAIALAALTARTVRMALDAR